MKRLSACIYLLIKENPILPVHFNFGGICFIEKLKKERQDYVYKKLKEQKLKNA